ncbi:MAG: hypothetical protein WEC33_01310 [Dehalococcoidia bacterium]
MSRRPRRKDRSQLKIVAAVLGGVLAIVGAAAIGILLAGDSDDDPLDGAIPTFTPDPGGFGPEPVFTDHILAVTPLHGSATLQSLTIPASLQSPGGLCAEVSIEGLGTQGSMAWFRVAFNDAEVTPETTQFPNSGRICYDPPEGLPVGRHTAAILLQDPTSVSSTPQELVQWKFEVVPD